MGARNAQRLRRGIGIITHMLILLKAYSKRNGIALDKTRMLAK